MISSYLGKIIYYDFSLGIVTEDKSDNALFQYAVEFFFSEWPEHNEYHRSTIMGHKHYFSSKEIERHYEEFLLWRKSKNI